MSVGGSFDFGGRAVNIKEHDLVLEHPVLTAKEKKTARKIHCARYTDMSQKWFADGIIDAPRSKKDFHDELVPTVWVVLDMDGGMSGTGFCINERGYILTCNHVCKSDVVHCSNLGPGDWFAQTKVVRRLPSWDMALLLLEDTAQRFDYVKMCDEQDQVFCGQDVYAIGNPNELHKFFMIGKVGYSCDELNPLDMDFEAAIDSYKHKASVHDPLMLHRTIGNTSSDGDFPTKNPNIPIIQIGRFCVDEGASGSPVFNKRGVVWLVCILLVKDIRPLLFISTHSTISSALSHVSLMMKPKAQR